MTLVREGYHITTAAVALAVLFVFAGTWLGGIVCSAEVGLAYAAGDRYGMGKFDAWMDVMVPLEVDGFVETEDRVTGGQTGLGTFPTDGAAGEARASRARQAEPGVPNA